MCPRLLQVLFKMAAVNCCMCFILFLLNWTLCLGLYQDQVGLFDWRLSYLGKVKFSFFDVSTHSSKRLYVGTESNVIAALNSRTGSIIWRQVLEEKEGKLETLLYRDNTLVSSSSSGKFIRSWDASNGALLWESMGKTTSSPGKERGNSPFSGWNGQHVALVDVRGNELVVSLSHNILKGFTLQDGSERWALDLSDRSAEYFSFQYANGLLHLVGVQNDINVVIQKVDVESGKVKGERTVGAPWVSNGASCVFVKKSNLVCAETFSNSVHVISLFDESAPVKTISLASLGLGVDELSNTKPSLESLGSYSNSWDGRSEFLLKLSKSHQLTLDLNADRSITLVTKFSDPTILSASVLGSKAVLVSITSVADSSNVELQCFDLDTRKIFPDMTQKVVLADHGEPENAVVYLFSKKENELGYRVLLATTDHAVSLIQFPGRIMWSREEALADITAVDVVELPFSPSQQNFETLQEEFGVHPNGK